MSINIVSQTGVNVNMIYTRNPNEQIERGLTDVGFNAGVFYSTNRGGVKGFKEKEEVSRGGTTLPINRINVSISLSLQFVSRPNIGSYPAPKIRSLQSVKRSHKYIFTRDVFFVYMPLTC